MPVRLPPFSRRQFLQGVVAGAGSLAAGARWSLGTPPAREVGFNRLALLSDTHLHADRAFVPDPHPQVNLWDNMARVTREVLKLETTPAAVLINGDVAFRSGEVADYATVIEALRPLRAAGLPVHCALGNHDNRGHFLAALPDDERRINAVADKCVSIVRLPHADWYLLDSLNRVNDTPGRLGPEQVDWLASVLDAAPQRAAIVMLHHQPDLREPERRSGLTDTEALLKVVKPRRQVKALLYGHTHAWRHHEEDGLHFINLPTTAYVFDKSQPAGWVDARLTKAGMTLQLRALAADHPRHRERLEFAWR